MKNIVVASLLTGLIVFTWGMISWMVLPWHQMTIKSFKNEQVVQLTLLQNIDDKDPHIYVVPACKKDCKEDQIGPFAFIALSPMGMQFSAVKMLVGFVNDLMLAFLVVWLLGQTKLSSYWDKVKFVVVIGLVAGIAAYLPAWNWWGFGIDYVLVGIVDMFISWLLGGLVAAKFKN